MIESLNVSVRSKLLIPPKCISAPRRSVAAEAFVQVVKFSFDHLRGGTLFPAVPQTAVYLYSAGFDKYRKTKVNNQLPAIKAKRGFNHVRAAQLHSSASRRVSIYLFISLV